MQLIIEETLAYHKKAVDVAAEILKLVEKYPVTLNIQALEVAKKTLKQAVAIHLNQPIEK